MPRMLLAVLLPIVLLGLTAIFLMAPPNFVDGMKPHLLVQSEDGFRPKPTQSLFALGLWLSITCLVGLFWLNIRTVTDDHKLFAKSALSPPVLDRSLEADPKQAVLAAYKLIKFEEVLRVPGDDGNELVVVAKSEPRQDQDLFWRRDGAIVYPDGTSTNFSLAVLASDDSWKFDDEILVQRKRMGRSISIDAALKRADVREVIELNDYVLTVGLASFSNKSAPDLNERKAHARAYNIGLAINKLKLKAADRIACYSLGYATKAATPSLEPRQRSVVIVGVNASRDVIVSDILDVSSRLINIEGVDLRSYSKPPSQPVRLRRQIKPESDYLRAEGLSGTTISTDDIYVLPAVTQVMRK